VSEEARKVHRPAAPQTLKTAHSIASIVAYGVMSCLLFRRLWKLLKKTVNHSLQIWMIRLASVEGFSKRVSVRLMNPKDQAVLHVVFIPTDLSEQNRFQKTKYVKMNSCV